MQRYVQFKRMYLKTDQICIEQQNKLTNKVVMIYLHHIVKWKIEEKRERKRATYINAIK